MTEKKGDVNYCIQVGWLIWRRTSCVFFKLKCRLSLSEKIPDSCQNNNVL